MNRTLYVFFSFLLIGGSACASTAFFDVNPSSSTAVAGETFSVGIELDSASSPGLAAYDLTVFFPAFLFANDVNDAGYFLSTGDSFYTLLFDNDDGILDVTSALNGTPAGDTGPDTLFTIDFLALTTGSGAITIVPNEVLDSDGNDMTAGAEAGSVEVDPAPEPSTFWMMAGAAVLAFTRRDRIRSLLRESSSRV